MEARLQKEQDLQQEILHVSVKTEQLVSFLVSSRPAVVSVSWLHSNCHLYDCWPLAGREEKFVDFPLPLLN